MSNDYQDKIVCRDELLRQASRARRKARLVVLCHGCFDIVHPGHIRHLEFARKHGDLLIVSITSDAAIDKDFDRPYIPQELRALNLAALELVDLVYIDPHHTARELLQDVKPDIYIKGEEYQKSQDPAFLDEQNIVEQNGGKVVFSSGDIVYSSTDLIQRLGREVDVEQQRLRCVCERHQITSQALGSIMERFSDRRVIVIGDLVVDRYVFCDAIDIARESPMMSLRQLSETTYWGGAAIVARHLAKLGAGVELITSLGSDELSRQALAQLAADGIETHSLLNRETLAIKNRYLVEDTKLLRVEQAEHRPLDQQAIKKAQQLLARPTGTIDAVVLCDFGMGVITERMLSAVLPRLRRDTKVLAADVSGTRSNLLRFQDVDLFCPTEREIRSTLQNFDDGLSAVAWRLMDATRVKHLIATLSRNGLVAFDRQSQDPGSPEWAGRLRSEYFQAFNDHAVDVLGCGDALLAGCTLALSCGATFVQAAYLGNALAAIEAGQMGNIPIEAAELRGWLARRPELLEATPVHPAVKPGKTSQPFLQRPPRPAPLSPKAQTIS